jgi:histidine ammonia-lyase
MKPTTVKKVPSTAKKTSTTAKKRSRSAATVSSGARSAKPASTAVPPAKPRRQRPLVLDGERLTRRAVLDVAYRGRRVELAPNALRRVGKAAKFLEDELKRGAPLYGVTTGFGSNADRLLAADRLRGAPGDADSASLSLIEELQHNLIVSHAVCVGEPLPVEVARAMLLIRLNTLLGGHSGIRARVLKLMLALLNLDITPIVPELGSVGASGDLAPLSHLALPLLGLGEVFYRGERLSSATVLAANDLEPVRLSCKEGLALNNGTTQMLAMAVLTLDRFEAALKQADINAALSLEAFCGRSDAFDARAHNLRPHPGQIATAANIRALTAGSGLIDIAYHRVPRFSPWGPKSWSDGQSAQRTFDIRWDYILPSERIGREGFYARTLPFRGGKKFQPQDAYSLRCVPQVHGAVKDSYSHACKVIDIELNSVTDNPLIFPGPSDSEVVRVLSAGNFHGMPLALALAQLKCAMPVLAAISERRLNKLLDPATNDGLPPFLIGNEDGTDSGLMIVQYTAASIVNELASRANPACVYSVPTSANAEDHVSMGTNDARHALAMIAQLESVLALELLTATQALDYRMQVLEAAASLSNNLGVQALRSKIRNVSPAKNAEAETLAADVKRLQADLRKLGEVKPSPVAQSALKCVRDAGLHFMARDRLLSPDIALAHMLVRSRAVIHAVEAILPDSLSVS